MRVTFRKTTFAFGIIAALGFSSSIAVAEEINVGANIGNVPWEFQDATGKIVGFEVDLVTEVGKRLGMDVKFDNIPFNGLFAAVQSGRIDMAVSSITITEKRLESVSFAQPYYDSDQSLTVKAASGITGLAGMDGKTVGVDTGSTGDIWATDNRPSKHRRRSADTKAWRRRCSTSRPGGSTAISATFRPCSTTPRTSRNSKWSSGSRPASNTR